MRIISILVLLSCCCPVFSQTVEIKPQVTNVDQNTLDRFARSGELNAYANLIRARAEYRRVLVEEAMVFAKNYQTIADGNLKNQQAAYIGLVREILEYEFNRIKEEDRFNTHTIRTIELHISHCNCLKKGCTNQAAWMGLDYLTDTVIPSATVKKVMFKKVNNLDKKNFVCNDKGEVKNFEGGKLGNLIDFLKDNNYSVVKYGDAHEVLLDMLIDLAEPAEKEIEYCKSMSERIRSKSLPVFQPPAIK